MEPSDSFIWYFAIGSMMNPVSLEGRALKPVKSYPAQLLDYELGFFGGSGMAEAVKSEGKSFHGVLHQMTTQDMEVLDGIETIYVRTPGVAKLYDGNLVECCVYCTNEKSSINNPPSERYIEILLLGCQHFGVAESHINFLKTIEVVPRRKPEDFQYLIVPKGLPTWTTDEIAIGNGLNGNPLYIVLNGKVREYIGDKNNFYYKVLMNNNMAGLNFQLVSSNLIYDPKYGRLDKLDDMSREHGACLEDLHSRGTNFKTVALFEQTYKD